jgi:anti-sigma factor RsiW
MTMDAEALEELIHKYADGVASPDELAQLNAALKNDPAAADLFVRVTAAEVLLRGHFDAARVPQPAHHTSLMTHPPRRWWAWGLAAAAVLAVALGVTWALRPAKDRGITQEKKAGPAPIPGGTPFDLTKKQMPGSVYEGTPKQQP